MGSVGRAAVRAAAIAQSPSPAAALASRAPGVVSDQPRLIPGDLDQDRVDVDLALVGQFAGGWRDLGEEIVQGATDEEVLIERHGPSLGYDDGHFAAYLRQPVSELLSVAHRRRKRHQLDGVRQPDDHLFPDGTAEPVRQVVHLI